MNPTHSKTTQPQLSRRELFKLAGASTLGLTSADALAAVEEQTASQPKTGLPPLNRFARMVQEYFVGRVRGIEQEALQRKAALKTKADAEAYVQAVRNKIRACFGPLPEKTPLNARVTGVVERHAYRIEKIIFESRPGLLVTSNLYLP